MLEAMRERAVLLIAAVVACGSPPRSRMYPAGTDKDDGYGDLARMSARLSIGGASASPFAAHHGRRASTDTDTDAYGGDPYGGASYGGATTDSGAPIALALPGNGAPGRAALPRYTPRTGLTGAIEGTVTWRGAPPPQLTTACGPIANPGIRVAANRGVAGVLVYIEHVEIGRAAPSVGRSPTVGGIITKRGCALGPALQILTPLPADLAIHGDTTGVVLRVTLPGGSAPFDLQPAGRIVIAAQLGVIRVEADDASLAPAWVVAADTPYYALTDERGRFRLDELAPGSYDVTFWQPPLATTVNGKLVYGAPVVVHRPVKVDLARPARVDLALP